MQEIQIISEAIEAEGCTHLAIFVNRCDDKRLDSCFGNV